MAPSVHSGEVARGALCALLPPLLINLTSRRDPAASQRLQLMTSISRLPTELQELICSFIHDQGDLASLSQTSKQLNRLAERFLYRSIHIKSIAQAGRLAYAIKRRGRVSYVREFTLDVYTTNFNVYDWAVKQLSPSNPDRDAYLQGLKFNTDILSLFPKLEYLCIHAQKWSPQSIRVELERIQSLQTLLSCSLAFKLPERARGDPHWDFSPWHRLFHLERLEHLELVRAEGDGPLVLNGADTSRSNRTTNLKSLRLLDCYLSHNWLTIYLRLPKAMKELEVVVTSEKAASFAEHMFHQKCSCMEPLVETLESLSYVNLRTVSGNHNTHHFAMFKKLKHLTTSATELFGDTSRWNIEAVLQSLPLSMPPAVQILRLYIHRLNLYGDPEGHEHGAYKVLRKLLEPENRHRAPALREIILHVFAKDPTIPTSLVSQAAASDVKIRLATIDEITALREKHQFQLLLS